jgi:hypothetical protein
MTTDAEAQLWLQRAATQTVSWADFPHHNLSIRQLQYPIHMLIHQWVVGGQQYVEGMDQGA